MADFLFDQETITRNLLNDRYQEGKKWGIQRGMQKGIEKGIQKGRQEAAKEYEAILSQLRAKLDTAGIKY